MEVHRKGYQDEDEAQERSDREERIEWLDHGRQGKEQMGARLAMIKEYRIQRGIVGLSWKTMEGYGESVSQRSRD